MAGIISGRWSFRLVLYVLAPGLLTGCWERTPQYQLDDGYCPAIGGYFDDTRFLNYAAGMEVEHMDEYDDPEVFQRENPGCCRVERVPRWDVGESRGFDSVERHFSRQRSKHLIVVHISYKHLDQIVTAEHWFDACSEHLFRRRLGWVKGAKQAKSLPLRP